MPQRVLISGFSPFPGAPVNPTTWLADRFRDDAEAWLPDTLLSTLVLETSYGGAPRQLDLAVAEFAPDILVQFGLARSARGFRLETTARRNQRIDIRDVTGQFAPSPDVCEGPETLPTGLPVEAIQAALKAAGLPVEVSDDAGGYLCNHVFYLARKNARTGWPKMSGFVHVPLFEGADARDGETAMRREDLWTGARLVLRTCIGTACSKAGDYPAYG